MSRNNNNYRFVYSTDGAHKNLCKTCGQFPCKCKKPSFVNPAETTLKIRLEKNGRGGKSVCVVFDLPHNPDYFSDIAKKLKAHCGTGGTYKDDKIEIQGDHRDKIKLFLEKIGFKVKLAGG